MPSTSPSYVPFSSPTKTNLNPKIILGTSNQAHQVVQYSDLLGHFRVENFISYHDRDLQDMAVGDVDKDGIPEIVIANYNHANQIIKYDENIGDFVAQDLIPGETMATRGVAIGDIDNDGNNEIVFANYDQVN